MANLTKEQFLLYAKEQGLSEGQTKALWDSVEKNSQPRSLLDFAHIAFYVGALLVILAMTWLLSSSFITLGGPGLFGVAAVYAAGFGLIGRHFWKKKQTLLGGLLITVAVCMIPVAVWGIQIWVNGPTYSHDKWVPAFFTVAGALVTIGFIPFPFLLVPLYSALWFLFYDVMPDNQLTSGIGILLAILIMAIGFLQNKHFPHRNYAFWSYFFGLLGFSFNFFFFTEGNELLLALFGFAHFLLLALSVPLRRTIFVVFGGLGLFCYLCYLAYNVFEDSIFFPFALVLMGVGVFFAGVYYQRHRIKVEGWLANVIPYPVYEFLQQHK